MTTRLPNSYLRHRGSGVWLYSDDGSRLYREDATFYQCAGLADDSKSAFESYSFPGRSLRNRDFLLYCDKVIEEFVKHFFNH